MIPAKIHLAHLPTRIEPLPRLSAALGGPRIFCKRDDQTGLGFGGNKTRKLEFLVAEAQRAGADLLVSVGAIQSNHCRQVAAAAARTGLDCTLVLSGEEPDRKSGNLLLDHLFGAKVVWATRENRLEVMQEVISKAAADGQKPYEIPYGGSSTVGMLGYAEAMRELVDAGEPFDWIVTASSSGGTQAGMVLGSLLHGFHGRILGIAIEGSESELKGIVTGLIGDCISEFGLNVEFSLDSILVNDHYTGAGYGMMAAPEIEAIKRSFN